MKVLHTADWHIGQFKGPVVDGVNLRSQDTVKCLNYMIKVAEEEKPDIVCVSGDVFHQEQIGPVRYSDEMIVATDTITKLAGVAKAVIVMRGTPNHDGGGQFRVLSKMFANTGNVHIVTSPTVLRTPYADIACIPGFDKQEFRSRFPGLSADEENEAWTSYISSMVMGLRAECHNTPILMAHYTVPGCNMESGQTSFFTNFEPVIPREALEAAGYEAVLLGHIHRPQILNGLHNVFYSGAINAMNFNDEGQERGFWIHEFSDTGKLTKGHNCITPYRRFYTITWDTEEVEAYIREGVMYLHRLGFPEDVADKIVRVRYSCTSEQKKQLNIPALQKDLYELGAFYVADIEAENAIDVTNRGLLSEESDPTLNLKKYLEEKCFKNPDKIVELAEPIIAEAMKQSTTAEIHGVFRPISIAVRNYRNYKEERFDFADISFCTINGVNGAGKSSLFMDAIVDCLFEETREGDNKAWIRGTEDARSGSIEFVFDIGDKRFRVVRTRTKSGKPTLNLSQYEENEWRNISKERIVDTQAEIEKLLGMDSMTFRSCALIMQDQYGLFLQAKKDERMAILGKLLGLGIYGVMELDSKKKLSEQRKELASKKEAVRIKTDFIKSKGDPESELQKAEEDIQQLNKDIEDLSATQGQLLNKHAQIAKAEQECRKASEELDDCHKRRKSISDEISNKTQILESCNVALESANEIREKAAEYKQLSEQIIELEKDVLNHDNAKRNLAEYNADIQNCQNIINDAKRRNNDIANLIERLKSELPNNLEEKLTELAQVRAQCEELQEKRYLVSVAEQELQQIRATYSQRISEAENRRKYRLDRISEIRQQEEFMKNSGCPDIDGASCRFLAKAIDDVKSLSEEADHLEKCEEEIAALRTKRDEEISKKQDEICIIGYDAEKLDLLTVKASTLVKYENLKKDAEKKKLEIARLETEKDTNSKTIGQYEESLLELNIKAQKATDIVDMLSDSVIKYDDAVCKRNSVAHFADQEKELPVYEERKQHIDKRLTELYQERSKEDANELVLYNNLREAEIKLEELRKDIEGSESLEEVERRLKSAKETLEKTQIQKGVLTQRVEDVETMRSEITLLNKGIAVVAEKADCYEALKQAFSQDGVPHQIIRNIIPHITDTANNILGSMTGGTMGVEFVMERTVKGKDGDRATLDVLINEYGKTTLPYASKSGGEKVKASLAIILALSEIKATSAGIQLGMLFIDEPPFLDDDGTQAYVDALETIRQRYPDVKIMAITHDDAMKARFNQSVTVIKTEDGSKVIY